MQKKNNLKIRYFNSSPEKKKLNEKFDVILCLEIVEHIQNLDIFLKALSKLLKKNGIIFIATINRTFQSYLKAIVGAEYILKWLPVGTHEWSKFLKPDEIESQLTSLNFNKLSLDGFQYNILTKEWIKSQDCSVNYIIVCEKN